MDIENPAVIHSSPLYTSEYFKIISNNLNETLTEFKKGKFEYKADKTGVLHVGFGKCNFTDSQLLENLQALYRSIEQNRPSGVKGKYFKTVAICTTMGPAIKLDLEAFA